MLTGSEMDAYYAAMLMFQMLVLPLTLQLTNIAGNLWSRTLTGARAERNEFLLLHEFHNNKFICPDKQPFSSSAPSFTIGTTDNDEESATTAKSSTSSRRKPAYSGGLVLEPKKGFYDRIVLLLDFNSLYPSIIQEYNICFTTVERGAENNVAEERTGPNDVPPVPDSSLPQGVLPRILKTLVERRRAVKSMMKKEAKLSESQLASLNIRQQALKLTANSMYGCLGFSHSRFYAKPLAILITAKGREILQSTVNLTRDVCQSDVIYGDTDSIMVNTRTLSLVDARALGQKIKRTVNEHYRLLEIELDAVFQKLLLLKKKKYAALIVDAELPDGSLSTRLETKGLDLVRRDWCPLSVDASTTILNEIMYAHADPEEIALRVHESLRLVAQDLKQDKIPLEKFIISKVNFKY
jgi:DNA polymerase alpha subunit A